MTSILPSDAADAPAVMDSLNPAPRVKRPGEIDYPCSLPATLGFALGGVVGAVMHKRRGISVFAGTFIWGGALMTSAIVRCTSMKARNATVYDAPQYDSTKSYAAGLGIIPILTRIAVSVVPNAGPIEPPAKMIIRSALLAAVGGSVGFIVDWAATKWPDKPPPQRKTESTTQSDGSETLR